MPGLHVYIAPLPGGSIIGRSAQLNGTLGGAGSGSISLVEIQFGVGGPVQPITLASPKATTWSWQGIIPKHIRPGADFRIIVRAKGTIQVKAYPEPEYDDVDGEGVLDVKLENVVPQLVVDAFQSPVAVETLPFAFRLSGRLTQGSGPPYAPRLQMKLGGGPARDVPVSAGRWSVDLSFLPGTQEIELTAFDDFDSSVTLKTPLTVLRYTRPADADPAGRKTVAGAPTTASVTGWTRIEPQCRDADVGLSAGARLFDPLWLMARQWQLGEFQAEDAGTPVQARVRATSAALTRARLGPVGARGATLPYDPATMPLEVLVERRRMRPGTAADARMLPLAVEAGQLFVRRLESHPVGQRYRSGFLACYAFAAAPPDADLEPATRRLVHAVAARAVDARRLAQALRPAPGQAFAFDAALKVATADVAALRAVCQVWLGWYDSLCAEPAGPDDEAWWPERLEHGVCVAARLSPAPDDAVTLTAEAFDGGRLDWSSFDLDAPAVIDTQGDKSAASIVETSVPAPVTFHGAPAPRYWEMEDSRVAYGLVSAGPTDQLQLMTMEYAGSYGNDWFIVPLTLKLGSVTRIESLVVTDTFGVRSLIRPMGDPSLPTPHFSMWQPSRRGALPDAPPGAASNCFFLAPSLGRPIDGAAIEEVVLLRDEVANMAWGVERLLEGPMERALALPSTARPQATPGQPGVPVYRLSSGAPDRWIPLVPVTTGEPQAGSVRLRRGAMLQPDGSLQVQAARSEALRAGSALVLFDEEVPREGVRVTRRRRLARWSDGSTWLWTAFRREVGRGEGAAGLRFDWIDEPQGGTDG